MNETVYHIPALLPQVIEGLHLQEAGVYADVTFGGGGHSRAIVEKLGSDGHLYGFDQDIDAVERAFSDPRFTIVHSNFRFIANFMRFYGVEYLDGILADLGVSFHHFDEADRGFSFRFDGPLDMRMNRSGSLTAADVVNEYTPEKLTEILRLYGEMNNARRIASAIVKARAAAPITTIEGLLAVVDPLIDPRRRKKDLACIFQALRIEVNDEMGALRSLLDSAARLLRPGSGRLAIITYHSLEDRMVKNFMRSGNIYGRVDVTDIYGRNDAPLRCLTSKPIVPSEAEVEANPRSRSAKLRIAVRNNES